LHFVCNAALVKRIVCSKSGNQGATMRGADAQQEAMHSYISPEKRVPSEHPLRPFREMVDWALFEPLGLQRLY
jgi:hypothetical protein